MLTYGIDVSAAQAEEVPGVTPGIDFAMIKATEGRSYVSPVQKAQAAAARKHGRVVGFYHFLWPGHIQEQAEHFVEKCASVPGDILAVDWERTPDGTHASNAEKDEMLHAVVRLRPHHRVLLYCNRDFWLNIDKTSERGDGLWIADYTDAGKPRIKAQWKFHQFSDGAGKLDRDVFQGSPDQLRSWATARM